MTITLIEESGKRHPCRLPYDSAEYVLAPACACGSESVHARSHTQTRDSLIGAAFCAACGVRRGTLLVQVNTIFGIEEDRCVLCGPAKVF